MEGEFTGGEGMGADGYGREDFESLGFPFHGDFGEAAGPRVVGADNTFECLGGEGEVEASVLAEELGCVGDFFRILRGACGGVFGKDGQGLIQGGGAEIRESVVEGACGFVCGDGDFFNGDDVPGIQFAYHMHDGDSRFRIAIRDGGLDAGCTPVFRKDGGVEIDDGLLCRLADVLPYDLPVSHHHDKIRDEIGEFLSNFAYLFRLPNRNAMRERNRLDLWRNRAALASSNRLVRLRDQQARFCPMLNEMAEGGERDISGSDEGEFQDAAKVGGEWREWEAFGKASRGEWEVGEVKPQPIINSEFYA